MSPGGNAASGSLNIAPNTPQSNAVNTSQSYTVTALDVAGNAWANQKVSMIVNGANAQQVTATTGSDGKATLSYTGQYAGTDSVQAVGWIDGQIITTQQQSVTWIGSSSTNSFASPGWIGSRTDLNGVDYADQFKLTQPARIKLNIPSGKTLKANATINVWHANSPLLTTTSVRSYATATDLSNGAILATLDTTTLANGNYIIQLNGTASDGTAANDVVQTSQITVTVAGEYKPGRVAFGQTDLTVPVTGLPISITRNYDSLNRDVSGDFGNGWQYDLSQQITVDPNTLDVTLTQPNGKRVTFFFTPTLTLGFYQPAYTAEPGVYGSLKTNGCGLIAPAGSSSYICFPGDFYRKTISQITYTDPYGRVYSSSYDPATGKTKLVSIQDLNNNILTFSDSGISSSNGGLNVSIVRQTSSEDSQDRKRIKTISYTVTDPTKTPATTTLTYSYSYDTTSVANCTVRDGDLSRVTLPDGTAISFCYDTNAAFPHLFHSLTDPRSNTPTITAYDSDGRLQSVTNSPDGGTTQYVTTFAYDTTLRTTTVTNPDGGGTKDTYDSYGKLVTHEEKQSASITRITAYLYDAEHNLRKVVLPDPATGSLPNDTTNTDINVCSTSSAQKRVICYSYTKGEVSAETNTLGVTSSIGFRSDYTLPGSLTLPYKSGTDYSVAVDYDANFNPTTIKDNLDTPTPTQTVGGYTWDTHGNKLSQFDGRATPATTTYAYDPYGNVSDVTQPIDLSATPQLSATTHYDYDTLGRQVQRTDPRNPIYTTKTSYDLLGRVVSVARRIDATTTTVSCSHYDLNGNVDEAADGLGRHIRYTYDNLNRVTAVTDPYPGAGNICVAGSALTQTAPPSWVKSVLTEYDWRGNVTKRTDQINHITQTVYNLAGQMVKSIATDNSPTYTAYDGAGRAIYQTDGLGAQPDTTQAAWPMQPCVATGFAPPAHTSVSCYNAADQLVQTLSLTVVGTTNTARSTQYVYDVAGRQQSVTDAKNATTQYDYNARGQLLTLTYPSVPCPTGTCVPKVYYAYDAAGNVTKQTTPTASDRATALADVTIRTVTSYTEANVVKTVTTPVGATSSDTATRNVSYGYDAAATRSASPMRSTIKHSSPTMAWGGWWRSGCPTTPTSAKSRQRSMVTMSSATAPASRCLTAISPASPMTARPPTITSIT